MEKIRVLASKRAAVIFTKSSCCMCHSIKALFYEIGASSAVHELDKDSRGIEMALALRSLGCNPCVPAIFIGGQFVGSAKDVISLHVDVLSRKCSSMPKLYGFNLGYLTGGCKEIKAILFVKMAENGNLSFLEV
ncbi:glutaredoxin-C11-like [Nicotiana sylvestris]|uniref:glutaredoxin-C11-like n=1 Tax=Nicotiana sylvestris TaxID=4096 RepID=UPI00388CCBF2